MLFVHSQMSHIYSSFAVGLIPTYVRGHLAADVCVRLVLLLVVIAA